MKLIEWSDCYVVNIKIIDEQHQQMAKTVNELYSLLGSKKDEATKYLVKKLIDGVSVHFDTEHKLMTMSKFVNYISHKLEHDRFGNEINSFYDSFTKGEQKVNLELLNTIKTWFFNHIEINDRKLADHINSLENKEELLKQFEEN